MIIYDYGAESLNVLSHSIHKDIQRYNSDCIPIYRQETEARKV